MFKPKEKSSTINNDRILNYTHYSELPLKLVGCWDWFPDAVDMKKIIANYVYLCLVIFVLINVTAMLMVSLYSEWVDIMSSLDMLADSLPYVASVLVVAYFAVYRAELYELNDFMNKNFKFHSARGLTNMTMLKSYKMAKSFAYTYTVCSLCSSTMYAVVPMIIHWWTRTPVQGWFFMDVTRSPFLEISFLRQILSQIFLGLALGQLGVFFASNSILLCGQLDLICCSARNARFTALLQNGVKHASLVSQYHDILKDEEHNYIYNTSEMVDSIYHYDEKVTNDFSRIDFDIYSATHDAHTAAALTAVARQGQVAAAYKRRFERFASPLLVLRVVQVTLYLCTLLYAASRKLDTMTVEYLLAVSLDIFIYCYYGNQIIIQADRVSTAAYQSSWHTMGLKPRRLLLNILLANKRQMIVRAGGFLPMDLRTYVNIIKTSFSYYTLLVNVNEHK
uniref:Odorant receptor n=1 Tax=Plutella xylostella TaxID=51655 RepID=A0A0U3TZD0_PLUXY|nr:olfactory receptor 9 [Plutella xylostella]